jgi:hypothetical protein
MQCGHKDDERSERLTLEMIKRFGSAAEYIARELGNIADVLPDISSFAEEMITRFGDDAVDIAREMADITKGILEMQYGEAWHDIADAIERYSNDDRHLAKGWHANDNDQPPSDNGARSC